MMNGRLMKRVIQLHLSQVIQWYRHLQVKTILDLSILMSAKTMRLLILKLM